MNNIDAIINSIKSVFKVSEDSLFSLGVMLENIDKNRIHHKFGTVFKENKYSNSELISKTNLLNALMEIVLENPNMEEIKSNERKNLLSELYSSTATLYEQLLSQDNDSVWNNLSYLVMYSMLSYLADKQTISNIVINEYNAKLKNKIDKYTNLTTLEKLELDTYYLIVLMVSNIKNYDGLLKLNSYIDKAEKELDKAQNEEIEKDELDIENGLKISAFGNIIYLTSLLKEYLFTGKIEKEENQDIYSVIDVYSYNAFYLLNAENIELKLIGYLLKYSYTQVAENSIWNIAEKSPKIRQFIENNLLGKGNYVYSLLPSQREVISDVLTPKKSIIVSMPTSSGKSLLAEMQILFSLHNYSTQNFKPTICYIVPTNALIEQVKRDLNEDFKEFEFNIETALPCYDVDEIEEEILNRKHIDILISTPEKLESLVRIGHPSIMNTRLVIMDEAHNIGDRSRGSKFELVLATIKQRMKEVNFLLLSPFIPNANEIGEWLADSKRNSTVVSFEWSPTNQYVGCNILENKKTQSILEFYKSARNKLGTENIEIALRHNPMDIKQEMQEKSINNTVKICCILSDFVRQEGNVLILCEGLRTTKTLAIKIKNYFMNNGELRDLTSNKDIKKALEIIKLESDEYDPLLECVKYGVCYHNSGLSTLVKETLEDLLRKNLIKFAFTTTTLAQGMNFPISTVIFETIKFRGDHKFTNAEFWNIAGRAGRAYKDKEGYIIVSFRNSAKETRESTKEYIKKDAEDVISSLNSFFSGDNQISLDYDFLKKPNNTPVLNLIQYISHILNIGYEYNINTSELAKIRTILNDSYLYHSLDKQEGYINAQMKLNNFVAQYVRHISDKKKEELKKADQLGISDISFSKVKSIIGAFITGLKSQNDNEYKASDIILKTKNYEKLGEIIDIISKIPEIHIEMTGKGELDSKSIAKLVIGWVNGKKISSIAESIRRDNEPLESAMELCNKYLNSQMKSYMPWGINIYQELSYDLGTENAKMLPSYIYYGVSNKEAAIISKIGVPRFAVKNVLNVLKSEHPELEIKANNIENLKAIVSQIQPKQYKIKNVSSEIIKEIVDSKIK
ncbi:DEAD/DEAH box helicase [Clostridium neuense]|uniref:DEAD/DEAH box helicase n=1 Tax=Clostridium neuense TaxID=1728934 RepID=A0ABW8TEF1_9CLOT